MSPTLFSDSFDQVLPPSSSNTLVRRKGGGGHGGGGGGHGSSSGHGGGRAGSSPHGSSSSKTGVTIPNSGGHRFSPKSAGGGKPYILPHSSVFAGRRAGGGNRNQIYGSYYYGSGYPYGGYGWFVYQRPLPYFYWPLPIYVHDEYGSNEYGPASNSSRPGGTPIAVTLTSPDGQMYRVVGDNSSVTSVLDSLLATNCKGGRGLRYAFQPTQYFLNSTTDNSSRPRPEEIIQYYRASSFALSLDGYNNTMALSSNAPSSNTSAPAIMTQTPLPSGLNTTFLQCINNTIGRSLPLDSGAGLSEQDKYNIIGGSIGGGLFLLVIIWAFWKNTEWGRRHFGWVVCAPCRRRRKEKMYAPLGKQDKDEHGSSITEVPSHKEEPVSV